MGSEDQGSHQPCRYSFADAYRAYHTQAEPRRHPPLYPCSVEAACIAGSKSPNSRRGREAILAETCGKVTLCADALSPQLRGSNSLGESLRSGHSIGPKTHLEEVGDQVVRHHPDVGS